MTFRTVLMCLAGCAMLFGCAEAARRENMQIAALSDPAGVNPALVGAACVGEVRGGEETDPLLQSEVDDAGFREALIASIRNQGLLAESDADCGYRVDANILGVGQPIAGLDMTVTAYVNYTVIDRASGDPFLLATVTTPHTAQFGDSMFGPDRLRMANEGAVRANIREFLTRLMAYEPEA